MWDQKYSPSNKYTHRTIYFDLKKEKKDTDKEDEKAEKNGTERNK